MGFDREAALQAVARGPAAAAAGEEIQHDGEVEPAFRRLDVEDVGPPLPVGSIRCEVLRHQIGRDRPGMLILAKICPLDRFLHAQIPSCA